MTLADRRGALISVAKKSRLPREYQEVEYLKGDGASYIDTLYKPNNNTKCSVNFIINITEIQNLTSSGPVLFGAREVSKSFYVRLDLVNEIKYSNIMFVGASSLGATYEFTDDLYPDRNLGYDIYVENNKGAIQWTDGVIPVKYTTSNLAGTFQNNYNIILFARNNLGVIDRVSTLRIRWFKIYENDIPQRDFVPCYRKSDSEPGMYDLVNNVFYTNAGTGEFDVGGDV